MKQEDIYQYEQELASAYRAMQDLMYLHPLLEPSDKIKLLQDILSTMNEDSIVDLLYYMDSLQAKRIAIKLKRKEITK